MADAAANHHRRRSSAAAAAAAAAAADPSPPPLAVAVAPVSGGHFPVQLGLMLAAAAAGAPRPNVVLATSGGNIAALIAAASDYDVARALAILRHTSTDMFLTSWSSFVPSWLFLPIERAVFRPGRGFGGLVRSLFAPGALASPAVPEFWTGLFETRTKQHRVACNRAAGAPTIVVPRRLRAGGYAASGADHDEWAQQYLGDNTTPLFTGGDRAATAAVAYASAAIPWLLKPVVVSGEAYSDGGSIFASPLTPLADDVLAALRRDNGSGGGGGRRRPAIFYFASTPLSTRFSDVAAAVAVGGDIATLTGSLCAIDVRTFATLCERAIGGGGSGGSGAAAAPSSREPELHSQMNVAALARLIGALAAEPGGYGVLLAPHDRADALDLTNIAPNDAIAATTAAMRNIDAFVWR